MSDARRVNWIVEVSVDDGDPLQFGPYNERQATSIERRLSAEVDRCVDRFGGNHHPHGWTNVNAWPIQRLEPDDWLTSEEKAEIRAEVREANKR